MIDLAINTAFVKVFSHNTRGGFFSSQADAASKNPNNPHADLFSILDQLERYRGSDGNFRFKLCYPELTWGVGGKKCNEWIQSSNPLTETTITGFKPISLAFTKNSHLKPWVGLGKSPSYWSYAAIDDLPTASDCWSAIGATKVYYGGFPGPRSDQNPNTIAVVKQALLYVQDSNRRSSECNNGTSSRLLTMKFDQEIRVENNKLLASVPTWGPTFRISFDLKILSFANCNPDKMANYLTFTATDNNCCEIGDRVPAFFTNSGGFLQLATQIDYNGNHIARSPNLEENVWYSVEVEQFFEDHEYFFMLRADGRQVFKEHQNNPRYYTNVKIYAAKYAPADAVIRNLAISYQA